MAELTLKSSRFRAEREADWKRLDALMEKVEKRGAKSLSDAELLAIPVLYRATLSSLSVARATSLDRGVTDYLEALSTRAYFFVYGARSTLFERLGRFFAVDWPRAVQSIWRETLLSAAIQIVAAVTAGWLVLKDPDWFYAFISRDLAGGRDPSASTAFLRDSLYTKVDGNDPLSFFAAYLFTHNAQIALMAFALGFAFCAPTVLILAANGCMLGAVLVLFATHGLAFQQGGWLLIHGVTELFAITLAGAAGFRIGWTLIFPGEKSRLEAAGDAGRTAATAAVGVVLMLLVAGMLESFARQLITDDWTRYGVAAVTAVVWFGYFYWPRSRRAA
ncbi:MAG: protein of unknown function transrane [Caulobacter sp.]|nr:protein of unknown function transrane [Caulobacter sp.]